MDCSAADNIIKLEPENHKETPQQQNISKTDGRETQHQCHICHKTLSSKPGLTKHIRVHRGEKPYKCTTCGKQFAQKCNLTIHERTHSNIKPYSCTTCEYRCIDKSNMNKHMRTHTLNNFVKSQLMCWEMRNPVYTDYNSNSVF